MKLAMSIILFALTSATIAAELEVAGVIVGKSDSKSTVTAMRAQIPEKKGATPTGLTFNNYKFFEDNKKRTRGISASTRQISEVERQKAKNAKSGDSIDVLLTETGVVGAIYRNVSYEIAKQTRTARTYLAEVDDYAIPFEQALVAIKAKYGEPHHTDESNSMLTMLWLYDENGEKSAANPAEYSGMCTVDVAAGGMVAIRTGCTKTLVTVDVESAKVLVGENRIASAPYVTSIQTKVVAGALIAADVIAKRPADEASVKKATDATKKNSKVDL